MLTNYVIAKWCHLIGTCLQWGLKNYAKSNVPKSAVLLCDHWLNKFGSPVHFPDTKSQCYLIL